MVKKRVVLSILILVLFSFSVLAANETKIENGFKCLSEKLRTNCTGTDNVKELSLSILASPENVSLACLNRLKSKVRDGVCFGTTACNIQETALAVLALNHANQNTTSYVNWLKNKNLTASELIWFIQQNSEGLTSCTVSYTHPDSNVVQKYNFTANENKKLQGNMGPCLTSGIGAYWMQVNPRCLNKQFTFSCEKDSQFTLLYKTQNSPIIYIVGESASVSANQDLPLSLKTLCFGLSNSCDYEGTAWGALALKKVGEDVSTYIPYLVSSGDFNRQFFPDLFLYMLVDSGTYGDKIIKQQKSAGYWEAITSAYNKYYDSGLALVAIGTSSYEGVAKAEDWLLNIGQQANGCWEVSANSNTIRDTAMVLWGLGKRSFPSSGGGQLVVRPNEVCSSVNGFCIVSSECEEGNLLSNYECTGGNICCKNNIKTCAQRGGRECLGNTVCTGENILTYSDSLSNCCKGECTPPENPPTYTCTGTNRCMTSCDSKTQTEVSTLTCENSREICCAVKKTNNAWIIILIIAVLILLGALGFLYKNQIKDFINKKFGKGKSGPTQSPSLGPRPLPGMMGARPGLPMMPQTRTAMPPQPRSAMPPQPRPTMPPSQPRPMPPR